METHQINTNSQQAAPLVTVVMPNYNEGAFVRDALESIVSQTYKNFECIVIDDGSSDDSKKIISEFAKKDPRIRLLENPQNLKICKTLNRGISLARGKYIARMDADDICLPTRFETQVNFLEQEKNKNVGVVGSFCTVVNETGDEVGKKDFPLENNEIKNALWYQNPIQHSTAMIRKEALEQSGDYNPDFVYAEDLDLWFRIGKKFELRNIPDQLMKYRVHGKNDIFEHQKKMIVNALRVRDAASKQYGYRMPLKARFFASLVGLSYFLPQKMVFWLFMKFRGGAQW